MGRVHAAPSAGNKFGLPLNCAIGLTHRREKILIEAILTSGTSANVAAVEHGIAARRVVNFRR